ncbi:hypothetical protein [Sorangium sp. So ce381]|uniref:hypothetical protein n=1 Tax=Sorangium sp. So ce381 TaxID=3133307 RepID=UPI003F5BE3AE
MTAHHTDYEHLQAIAFEYNRYPDKAAAILKSIVSKLVGGMMWGGKHAFAKVTPTPNTRAVNDEFAVDNEGVVTGSVLMSLTFSKRHGSSVYSAIELAIPVSIKFVRATGTWVVGVAGETNAFGSHAEMSDPFPVKDDSELNHLQSLMFTEICGQAWRKIMAGDVTDLRSEDTQ